MNTTIDKQYCLRLVVMGPLVDCAKLFARLMQNCANYYEH